jgi:hypothetical protein
MAPRQSAAQPQYLDEHHQRISEFAAEYFDDDEEREVFVDTIMERRGYQRTASWSLPPPPDPAAGQGGDPAAGAGPGKPRPPAYFKR